MKEVNKESLQNEFGELEITRKQSSRVLGGYKWRTTVLWVFDDGPRRQSTNVIDLRTDKNSGSL